MRIGYWKQLVTVLLLMTSETWAKCLNKVRKVFSFNLLLRLLTSYDLLVI